MKNKNQKASPPENNKSLIKHDAWELEEPDEATYSLEALLDGVNKAMAQGREIKDILRRRQLPQLDPATGQPLMTEEEYTDYTLDFYSTKTSKGYKPAIGIRHMRSDIWDMVYLITRSPEVFPGRYCRLVSIVETCTIHAGLHGLDLLLAGRPKVVQNRKNAIWKGGKYKRRRPRLPPYKFVNFTDTEEKQQNIWCLSPEDYARIAAIAEDYGWDMGFVVQMTMVIAIASSENLPESLREDAKEEAKFFEEYLNRYL